MEYDLAIVVAGRDDGAALEEFGEGGSSRSAEGAKGSGAEAGERAALLLLLLLLLLLWLWLLLSLPSLAASPIPHTPRSIFWILLPCTPPTSKP